MKLTDFKRILKKWLSSFLDPFTMISKGLYKLFQKIQNVRPVGLHNPQRAV